MSQVSKRIVNIASHFLLGLGTISFFALGPIVLSSVQAYNASDYNPQYTPYNFENANGAKLCRDAVKAFDSEEKEKGDSHRLRKRGQPPFIKS